MALPPIAIETLRVDKAGQAQERLLMGPAYSDHGLVVPRAGGHPWEPDSFTGSFAAFMRGCGLRQVTFHSLRHSHATLLLKQGINSKIVSERLGHARVGTTLHIYSHVLPGMQDEAAKRIDASLRVALGATS